MTVSATRIGEVIEATTLEIVVQCDELHESPPLGAVVVVREGETETFALVSHVETSSIDPGRRAVARGAGLPSAEELYRRHPELGELLRTVFTAIIVAHRREGRLYPYVPARPPRVHAFVHSAKQKDAVALADNPAILPVLAAVRTDAGDDFIAASIRILAEATDDPAMYLLNAGRRLVHLLHRESQRLQTLLPKIRPE
jgi:hypothetical protein